MKYKKYIFDIGELNLLKNSGVVHTVRKKLRGKRKLGYMPRKAGIYDINRKTFSSIEIYLTTEGLKRVKKLKEC